MASFPVRRVGTILAVTDVDRSVAFYTERLGFTVDALYDDPPYATLTREGVRLSLAEQGHPAPDRPGITMVVPDDPIAPPRRPRPRGGRRARRSTPRSWGRGRRSSRNRTRRPGVGCASSSSIPTGTSSRSSSRVEARAMRAVVLAGVGDLRLEEVAEPRLIEPGDAIVRVTTTGLCGADLFPFHGHTPGFEDGTILGHEFVGVVEAVGPAVRSVRVGDRVVSTSTISCGGCAHCRAGRASQCLDRALFGYSGVYQRLDGGQAERVRVPYAERGLYPLPDAVSDEAAVFVADMLPTGLSAVLRGEVALGDLVVVVGCGTVGLMAVLFASRLAREVIAVDGIPARRELAERFGARAVSPEEAADDGRARRAAGSAPTPSSKRRGRPRRSRRRFGSSAASERSRSSARTSSPTSRSTTACCSRRR